MPSSSAIMVYGCLAIVYRTLGISKLSKYFFMVKILKIHLILLKKIVKNLMKDNLTCVTYNLNRSIC